MGLPYPGGPVIDKLAKEGNPKAFTLNKPQIAGYDYSFSGLKTSFLYLLRDRLKENPQFIEQNRADLCATLQATIIDILLNKLVRAAKDLNISEIALAGGVSANSGLRQALVENAENRHWKIHLPPLAFTTDNAAMVAMVGTFKYDRQEFCPMEAVPFSRVTAM
jgi:N6-L-threonylcarbamoyladenine synthase